MALRSLAAGTPEGPPPAAAVAEFYLPRAAIHGRANL